MVKGQEVKNNSRSDWSDILSGLGSPAEGIVRCPLLIAIFMNDWDECTSMISTMKKFKDNTKLRNEPANIESAT